MAGERYVLALIFGIVVGGCGTDVDRLCEDYHECVGGGEADVEACRRSYELLAEAADITDCGERLDDLISCRADSSVCHDAPLGIPCISSADCGTGASIKCGGGLCLQRIYDTPAGACESESLSYRACAELAGEDLW